MSIDLRRTNLAKTRPERLARGRAALSCNAFAIATFSYSCIVRYISACAVIIQRNGGECDGERDVRKLEHAKRRSHHHQ